MKKTEISLDRYSITCADVYAFLTDISGSGILIKNVFVKNSLSVIFYAQEKYRKEIVEIADKYSAQTEFSKGRNWRYYALRILKRKMLLTGLIGLALISILLPQKILFIKVEGNSIIPDRLILEKAALNGLDFWTTRKNVRSEKIKNALLSEIPQLEWAGVNTSGCNATISVIERNIMSNSKPEKKVSSIVAVRDGIIQNCTVTKGNLLCRPGQAVKKGQILISGYIDTGILIRAVSAEGEISALTNRKLHVLTPQNYLKREAITDTQKKFSVIIGKKLINLYEDSGILDVSCVKINKIYPLTLPGGLKLPISLLCQDRYYYNTDTAAAVTKEDICWLYEFANKYLSSEMISGSVINSDAVTETRDETVSLTGSYLCQEIIGKPKSEESMYQYAKDD